MAGTEELASPISPLVRDGNGDGRWIAGRPARKGGGLLGRSSAQPNQPYGAPYQLYPQPGAPAPSSNTLAQLQLLGHLRESGLLTEEEFQQQKQRILNGF